MNIQGINTFSLFRLATKLVAGGGRWVTRLLKLAEGRKFNTTFEKKVTPPTILSHIEHNYVKENY